MIQQKMADTQQKMAVSENFETLVRFVADLGVTDLMQHLKKKKTETKLSSCTYLLCQCTLPQP